MDMTLDDFIQTIKQGTMENPLIEIRDQEDYTLFLCSPNAKVLNPYRQNNVRYWFIPSLHCIKADIVVSIWER
jgi:hypothetical protein